MGLKLWVVELELLLQSKITSK